MQNVREIQKIVEHGLKRTGLSARQASLAACEREDLVRDIRRGRVPSFLRMRALLDTLGVTIEIIDPTNRSSSPPENLNKPGVNSENPIDKALLKTAIETCERGLDEIDRELEAGKKAEMVLAIYDLLGDNESSTDNKNNIVKLITRNVA